MKLKDFVLWVGHLLVLTALIYQSARGSLLGVIAVALVLSAVYYLMALASRRESFLYLANALLALGYLLVVRLIGSLETALLLALPLVLALSIAGAALSRRELPKFAEACDWVAHGAGIGAAAAVMVYFTRLDSHGSTIVALLLYAAMYLLLVRVRQHHWFLLPASLAGGLFWFFVARALWPEALSGVLAILAAIAVIVALKGRAWWRRGPVDRSAPVHTAASILALAATMLAFFSLPHEAGVLIYLLAALAHTLVLAFVRREEIAYLIIYTLGLMAWNFIRVSGDPFLGSLLNDFFYSLVIAGALFLYPAVRMVLRYGWSLAEWLAGNWQRVLYIGLSLVVLMLAWDLTWLNAVSENPNFCNSCHSMEAYVQTWQQSKHSRVACDTCHYAPGLGSTVQGRITGLMMVVKTATGLSGSKAHGNVVDASCLRAGCHTRQALFKPTMFRPDVKFNHALMLSLPQARGINLKCVTCHSHTVQGEHFAVQPGVCFTCHLMNPRAETGAGIGTCQTCHLKSTPELRQAGQVTTGDGAVDEERCLRCHLSTEGRGDHQRMHDVHISSNNDFRRSKIECFDCHRVIRHGKGSPFRASRRAAGQAPAADSPQASK